MINRVLASVILIFLPFQISASDNKQEVNIIIESLPFNTPQEDTIFACGNFNNWQIKDPLYQLRQCPDGKLYVSLPVKDTLEFKFSRGEWMTIETGPENKFRPNRVFYGTETGPVIVSIKNWQDLGGQTSIPLYILILSAAVLNGLFLSVVILRIKKRDTTKTNITLAWTAFLIITYLGAILYEFSDIVWKFRLLLAFQVLLFIAGPLLFHLFKIFFHKNKNLKISHFWPVGLAIIINIPRVFNLWPTNWAGTPIKNHIFFTDLVLITTGSLLLGVYSSVILLKIKKINKNHRGNFDLAQKNKSSTLLPGYEENQSLIEELPERRLMFYITATTLTACLLGASLFTLSISSALTINFYQDIVFAISAIQLFIIFYYVYFSESVFLLPLNSKSQGIDLLLVNQMKDFMVSSKPYKDPNLSLNKFSELLGTKPHVVSRTVNEYFHKNFRDFINEYRVNEFINQMNSEEARNLTFLSVALEVGFNSKSTFNLAFKKATGVSPKSFFKSKSQHAD